MKKLYFNILVICICIIIFYIWTKKYNNNKLYKLLSKTNRKFPFRYFQDQNLNILPIVAITAFYRESIDKELYYKYINNDIKVIGVTAYKTFPKNILDVSEDKYHLNDNFNYLKEIKNWLCCFKNPKEYGFTKDHNIIDISESDFYDIDIEPKVEKKYDFIYICNKDDDKCSLDGWNAINRNYKLALLCFPIMINEYKLKGLIVGRVGCNLEKIYGKMIETTDFLPWNLLQEKMKESKFLFLPNIYDASPRVIAECIIKDLPILMNINIVCGFKYIDYETGEFFNDETDIRESLTLLLNKLDKISPKKWWIENYGIEKSAVKLRNFLYLYYPNILENVTKVTFII
jgi:hypothetical protein